MKDFIKKTHKKIKRFKKTNNFNLFLKNAFLLFLGFLIIGISVLIIWISTLKMPDFNSFEERLIVNSTKIYDKTGKILLYDVNRDIRRTSIPFEKMSTNIRNATIAVEDAEFYKHNGIRISSIIRAVFSNFFNIGAGGGGSTITQQLVKNTLLTSKKSIIRKVKEWILAVKIDSLLSKEKILELYLNEVPYGGTIYGIEEASKTYFGKNAIDLSIAESAYLASIPQSPTVLSPYGKNLDKLEERKNFVLYRMFTVGFITEEEYTNAKNERIIFEKQSPTGIKAPHFVFFIKNYLEEKYGKDVVEKGGLKVITTLDYSLQEKAEEYVKEGALKNEREWGGSNASLVAIDPKTGQILAMVGSRDYFDKEIDGNFNVATAERQPGSSFKPFIYATAFNKGFTPETVLFDLPTEFQSTCNAYGKALPGHSQKDCYMPENYDGKWRGPISLKNALAQSINIPAVKLFYLAGLSDSLKTAEEMGISTLTNIERYGLTLVIGGGEVTLLDITSAYGVFANNGIRNKHTGILEVTDMKGNILEKFTPSPKEVLPLNTALTISSILSDNKARVPTFGENSPLKVSNYEVAVKTGTTNSNKDAWIIGYTPSLVVGVWAGNNDNKPMKKGGSAMAGPIWNKFMNNVLVNIPNENFDKPYSYIDPLKTKPILRGVWQGNERFFIDKISGKLATEFTPEETKVEKVITNVHTILHWIDRNDILGPKPERPENNSQYNNWEIPIQNWWAQNSYKYLKTYESEKPTLYDDIHGNYNPSVFLIEPNQETIYKNDELINIKVSNSGLYPLSKMDIFINGNFINTTKIPFNFSFYPKDITNLKEENEIKINVYDSLYNKTELISLFRVVLD